MPAPIEKVRAPGRSPKLVAGGVAGPADPDPRGGGLLWWIYPEQPPAEVALALPEEPSIAVLPFRNLSDDAEQEFFVDGLTEDLITIWPSSRGCS